MSVMVARWSRDWTVKGKTLPLHRGGRTPAPDAGEKKKGNRGIPRGTGQRNSAGLKTREQNEENRHPMPGKRHTKRPDSMRQNRNRGRDTGRGTEQRKAGIRCRGKEERNEYYKLYVMTAERDGWKMPILHRELGDLSPYCLRDYSETSPSWVR